MPSFKIFGKKSAKKPAPKPAGAKTKSKGGDNKKALLLLLLLAGGGGAYVYLGGGLEPVMQLLGLAEEEAAPPPIPLASTTPGSQKPSPPPISGKAVSGQIQGKTFKLDYAEFKNGVLTLRQGKQFALENEISVSLPNLKWQVPAGKTLIVSKSSTQNNPEVTVKWKPEGANELASKSFDKGYSLELKFGGKLGNKVSGSLALTLPEAEKTEISGKFDAELAGFKVVNGSPDLGSDSGETLMFVALAHLIQDDPNKPISNVVYRNAKYDDSGRNRTGSLEVEYQVGKGPTVKQWFEFKKEEGIWTVSKTEQIK
ncbi:MAG: hypothetical protein OEY67_06125 [Gammaproteobacteria bacterium]|nr:hypothetical protein [Gammaproteobacteria bacterium]